MNDLTTLKREHSPPGSPDTAQAAGPTRLARPPIHWKTRVLLPAAILAAVASLLLYAARDVLTPAVAVQVAPVVARDDIEAVQVGGIVAQAPGWVEPDPFAVGVPALADGVVREVLVLEGQTVARDQVLVRLVDEDARLALARAEAELADARAELRAAERKAGAAGQGDAGAIALAEVRRELDRLPVQIAAARARLAELAQDSEAKATAAQRGVVSAVTAAMAEARAQAAQAELASMIAQEPVLQARLNVLTVEVEQALDKARAAVSAASASRDEAALRLSRMDIRSPIDGRVLSRNVEPGMAVMASSPDKPPVRLYFPDRLQVRVDVPLVHAARVMVGMAAEITVDVLPDRVFSGKVTRIVNEADIQRNTLQFKVQINDPAPVLMPEMLSRVKFIAPVTKADGPAEASRLFVPAAAASGQPGQTIELFIADPARNVALARKATLGHRHGDHVEITAGLNVGDRLIVSPSAGLTDGRRIRIASEHRNEDIDRKGDNHAAH